MRDLHQRKEQLMFFGPTSNWRKQIKDVTNEGKRGLPTVASQYTDGSTNAIRVHCGAEAQVLLKVEFYLTSEDDFEAFDTFLKHFGLPRNGYQVVDTHQPYTAYPGYEATPLPIAPPIQR